MKIKHTPHAIAELFQKSDFWQRAMWELRYENSQINFVRDRESGAVHVDVFDRHGEYHGYLLHLDEMTYRALVTKFMSHCGKHRSTINHDVGFRPKKSKSIEQLELKQSSFKLLDTDGSHMPARRSFVWDEPQAKVFDFNSFAKKFQKSEKSED